MGSTGSKNKQFMENVPSEKITTPILTPEPRKKIMELDPRSPSSHVSRTPLQILSAAAEKLEELKDSDLHELDNETPAKSKTILLGMDPRSPTIEFKRTPIVINVEVSDLPKQIRNKNLDKARQSTIITTPKSLTEKQGHIIPPKLLESSPFRLKPNISKRKSFVGLLETNIDFTETDLDVVLQEKCKIKENLVDTFSTPSGKVHIGNEDIDPRSPSNDFLRTPIQIGKIVGNTEESDLKVSCIEEPKEVVVELQNNDLMDKIEIENIIEGICEIIHIEHESINEEPLINNECNEDSVSSIDDTVEVIEERPMEVENLQIPVETKSAPVTPPASADKQKSTLALSPIENQAKSAPVTPPVVNITADVNELDKKLTNLIYQDEDIIVCPRIVKLQEHSNRSPLRNCNRVEPDRRRSVQKLKVSDKPRKSDYAVSKIPVFKEKGKNQVQCENTPPRNMEKRKEKSRSQWDNADKTLII